MPATNAQCPPRLELLMSLKSQLMGNWKNGSIGSVSAVLLGALFFFSPLGEGLRHLSYELPFLFRSDIKTDAVVILYMDDDSHHELRQPWFQEWDREVHAQLLDHLRTLGAKAVVFDILFDEPTTAEKDQKLIQAARRHGKVIFAAKVTPQIHKGEIIGFKPTTPFTNVLKWGMTEFAGADKAVRQHYRDTLYHLPSLAWMTVQATATRPPSDPSLPRWVNYYGPPGVIPHYSFYQARATNDVLAAAISNKVVFVGALYTVSFSGGMGTDDFRTPYTRWTGTKSPGVEINATTYLNLLQGDWLTELPLGGEWAMLIFCGLIFGFGLVNCRPLPALAVALAGFFLVSAAAIVVQGWQRVWFPWLVVGAVQIPTALAWSILAHGSRLHRDNRVLEMALAMSRAGTPLSDSPTAVTKAIVPASGGEYSPISISPFSDGRAWPGSAPDGAPPPIPDHALIRCIGRGAYGEVWLARDVIGTYHAVKVVHRKTFKDDAPFEREFRGIQKFTPISRTHPGFVNILHVGRNDQAGYFYYIMELGDDENTGPQIDPKNYSPKNLARALARSGRMAVPECLRLSLDLTAALEHLHRQQLIHRDIKPSNIIFVNGIPKFADIGLVTDIGGTGHDVTYVGTAGYIAPEGPGTPAADVYSLAKVIYELSTGLDRSRFPELPTSIVEGVDDLLLFQLNKIILKACENDLAKRYHSAAEMQADLSRLVARDSKNPARHP